MVKYKSGYGFLIKWLIGIGDLIILNLIFYVTCRLTAAYELEEFYSKVRIMFLLLNFSYFFAVYFVPIKIYKPIVYLDSVAQRSLSLVSLHAILFITCLFFLKLNDATYFSIRFILYFYLTSFCIFALWRILARIILKRYRRFGRNYKGVVIVGAGKNGMNLYAEMKKDVAYGFHIYGFFDDNILLNNTIPNYLGMTHEVEDFILNNKVDEIYCTLPNSKDEKIMRIFNFAEKNMIRFYIIPEFSRYVKKRLTMENIESLPIMAVRSEPLQSFHNQIIKRIFDILFAFVFLVTLFPVLYIIFAALIKMSSSGPVIFKQIRTGIYGKDFFCYKFRSMKTNEQADEKQAEKNDPRTTKIGRFLRRSNLDEIPQFYNVLKGEMSVVGPRPHMLKHTELYSTIIDKYMVRHLVKPGITGWAQVNGYRGETKTIEQMEGRVRNDVWYLENWTFLLDIKIVFVTVFNMFKGEKNAY
ncbi:MAG: undecaprenyl-phosphate glucose phosphotransferase [Dysgonamonadaceae bacterium]|jgi:putative colanic acid biosynthesis UDP-glucose lipid carrier transferase|nr:undecaprenyl-phosphate glucose phosphotransferase [Dysgonamonadaceae bacterium]